MRTRRTRAAGLVLALLFFILPLFTGCAPQADGKTAPSAAAGEESVSSYEQYSEQQLREQSEFSEWEDALFREEASVSQIDLHYLLKDPSSFGISSAQYLYTPVTTEFMEQSRDERQELREALDGFQFSLLSDDQKLTCRILKSLLDTEQMRDGLELYEQPLASTIGVQAQLPILLCEYQFYDRQDVEDYLKLLDGVDEYFSEILAFEQQKADAGLMMSDTSIDHVIESCEAYLLVPGDNFMIDTFNERLEQLPDLTEEEKENYRVKNEELLENVFVTAYQSLIDGMSALRGTGVNEGGQCGYPQGREYYEYLVSANTGTSYESMEEMTEAVEQTIQTALEEIAVILGEHPELAEQFGSVTYRQTEPTAIMEELARLSREDFPALPECRYTVKDIPEALELSLSPAFYLTSPIDDIADNTIYINRNERYASQPLYHTLAHEGYPGHLYQTVYFHSGENSELRKILSFPGYTEGWATYVEHLSYELDNGLDPDMARLLSANSLASLGLHAILDISINYQGWGKEQVTSYLSGYYTEPEVVTDAIYEAMVENPGNYLSYFVGCMEFMEMRSEAEQKLGDRFSALEFHRFLLDMGNAPFDVIRIYFSSWLAGQKL
ncbi:MAG: DUF885 domain-containing protein [Clostridiales bacterium]|nr:DUF885 domain-containing protein [Clostridiales bacterium]